MNRQPRLPLIVAACFAALSGIAATQEATKAPVQKPPAASTDDSPDAWLTMKVKLALLTTKDVPAMAIDVDTVHDVVTLSGKVQTEAAKTRAGEVAKGVEGVKEVKNIVQVVPESQEKVVEKADDEIQAAVKKALDADQTLKGISVKSVDKGVVLLAGKATTKEALRAVQAAYKTAGVRSVSSEIALEK
jgi:hyperosmotically inducible periplasmic protein